MAHLELAEGVFIEYETVVLSGIKRCLSAQLDCTFDDITDIKDSIMLLDSLGLDDNASLAMHINDEIYKGNI